MSIKKIKRTINYFDVRPILNDGHQLVDFIEIFTVIYNLSDTKDKDRFVINKEKRLYITNLNFDDNQKRISGKIFNIRMDSFPELINTSDDKIRDIEADDDEGIIETAHFILSYSDDSLILSFEFNQFGPRISDFIYYIENISYRLDVLSKIKYQPFVRDELESYKKRINRVSSVIAKVHKDDVKRINEFDSELFDAFDTAERISDAEYVSLQLNYDYRQMSDTPKIKEKIFNIINAVIGDKSLLNIFKSLKVRAEDEDTANRIKDFDLLNIWVKSRISVQKKEKSRVILSSDILLKMNHELSKEFK